MQKDYQQINLNEFGSSAPAGQNKTVFGELKLSQILLGDIDVYKAQINASNEQHQKDKVEIEMLTKNLKEQNRIIHKLKLQFKQQLKELEGCKIELIELQQRLRLEQDQKTTL
jgi:hypothetical protein